ncbi:MAG: FtsQ-type POTRA domain-containing protein [Acutalibacteraceae bacterium]|nr:FtsQ-type POTRA domain-containing protein [Acutalibacteraceae bacterium]
MDRNDNIKENKDYEIGDYNRRLSKSKRRTTSYRSSQKNSRKFEDNNQTDDFNKDKNNNKENDYNTPFFSNSSVKSQVEVRTNRAEDFFENKDYKPWDTEDDFNKRHHTYTNKTTAPKVRRRPTKKMSGFHSLKNGVGRVSKSVLTSNGDDENIYMSDDDSFTGNIKNNRNNKRLLDELNNNKKPLTKGQRKAKNILLSGCMIFGALVLGIILSLTVLFRCEQIEVIGISRYSQSDIIIASNLSYGENIFIANKEKASNSIEEKYPYIEKAEISFALPNKLVISVSEATPEYYIQSGTKYYIISKKSKLLEEVSKRELDIPTIKGCKLKTPKIGETANVENPKVTTVLNEVAQSIANNNVSGIKEIDLTDMSGIELNYQDRINIVLGMPEYIDYKFRTAMTIIHNKLSDKDIGRLDCSGLIEDRTDGKSNASYFKPNNLIVESTEPATEPATEPTTEPATEFATDIPTEPYTEWVEIEESSEYSDYNYDSDSSEYTESTEEYLEENTLE